MSSYFRVWIILLAAVFVAIVFQGCSEKSPDTKPITPKVFGVLNSFPEHPYYVKKQTAVIRHKINTIESLTLKPELTQTVIEYLKDKGYDAQEVSGKDAMASGQVDMIIEIVPRQVFKIEGLVAYGFSDRNILLGIVKQRPRSYIAMELVLSRKHTKRVSKTNREERFSQLGETTLMPDTWDELTQEQKERFEANLRDNMVKAVTIQLNQLKI